MPSKLRVALAVVPFFVVEVGGGVMFFAIFAKPWWETNYVHLLRPAAERDALVPVIIVAKAIQSCFAVLLLQQSGFGGSLQGGAAFGALISLAFAVPQLLMNHVDHPIPLVTEAVRQGVTIARFVLGSVLAAGILSARSIKAKGL